MNEPYEPENRPGTINRGQLTRIMLTLADRGIKDHNDRAAELSRLVHREISSTNDLSYREAASIILGFGRKAHR